MTQTELADKEVKRPIIKIPHKLKKVEEKMNIMKEEMKDVRKEQIELLEMKNVIPRMINILGGINIR